RRLGVPRRNLLRPRGQLRVLRDDLHLDLFGVGDLALPVPPVVELAPVLLAPLLRGVVWGVDRTGRVVREPRLVRVRGPDVPGPGDRLVSHVGREVVPLLWGLRGVHWCGVPVEHWVVLVRLPLVEAVEIVEPQARRPAVERPGWADLRLRGVVPLAKAGG